MVLCNGEDLVPEVWTVPGVVWGSGPILVLCTIGALEKSRELALTRGVKDWELDIRPEETTLLEVTLT